MSSSLHSLRKRLSDKTPPRLKNKSVTELPGTPIVKRPSSPLTENSSPRTQNKSWDEVMPLGPTKQNSPPKKTPPKPPPRRGTVGATDMNLIFNPKVFPVPCKSEETNEKKLSTTIDAIVSPRKSSTHSMHSPREITLQPSPKDDSDDTDASQNSSPEKIVWKRNPEAERIRQMLLVDSKVKKGSPTGSPVLRRNTLTLEPTESISPITSPRLKFLDETKKDKLIKNVSDRLFSLRDSIPLGSRTSKEHVFEITRSDDSQAGLDNLGKEFAEFSNKEETVQNNENTDDLPNLEDTKGNGSIHVDRFICKASY